jgi:hypothetical protein
MSTNTLQLSKVERLRIRSQSIVSSHLAFTKPKPTPLQIKIRDMNQGKAMPDHVRQWLGQVSAEEQSIAQQSANEINASRLANRIVHKYLKYGATRFYPNSVIDFYDGSLSIGSSPTTLTFCLELRDALHRLITQLGIDGDEILGANRMYLSNLSLERFGSFIKALPVTHDEAKMDCEAPSLSNQDENALISRLKIIPFTAEETPVAEVPVVESLVAEVPVVESLVAEVPVVESLVAEVPVVEVPVLEATSSVIEKTDESWGSWLYSWVGSNPVETSSS